MKENKTPKKKDTTNFYYGEESKTVYKVFLVIGILMSFITFWSVIQMSFYFAFLQLIGACVAWRLGVRFSLLLKTIAVLFGISVCFVSMRGVYDYYKETPVKEVLESAQKENSSMSAELEKMKKESVKQSEAESMRESESIYQDLYTTVAPTEAPTTVSTVAPDETLPEETKEPNMMKYDPDTGKWNPVYLETPNDTPTDTEASDDLELYIIPMGAKLTKEIIYNNEDLYWCGSNEYYGHVVKRGLVKSTIELSNGDVVEQRNSVLQQVPLYGFKTYVY